MNNLSDVVDLLGLPPCQHTKALLSAHTLESIPLLPDTIRVVRGYSEFTYATFQVPRYLSLDGAILSYLKPIDSEVPDGTDPGIHQRDYQDRRWFLFEVVRILCWRGLPNVLCPPPENNEAGDTQRVFLRTKYRDLFVHAEWRGRAEKLFYVGSIHGLGNDAIPTIETSYDPDRLTPRELLGSVRAIQHALTSDRVPQDVKDIAAGALAHTLSTRENRR